MQLDTIKWIRWWYSTKFHKFLLSRRWVNGRSLEGGFASHADTVPILRAVAAFPCVWPNGLRPEANR